MGRVRAAVLLHHCVLLGHGARGGVRWRRGTLEPYSATLEAAVCVRARWVEGLLVGRPTLSAAPEMEGRGPGAPGPGGPSTGTWLPPCKRPLRSCGPKTVGAFAQVSAYSAPDMTYDPLVAAAEATGVDPSTLRLDDLGSVCTTHLTVVSLSDFNGARALQGQDPRGTGSGHLRLGEQHGHGDALARAVLDAAPR